MTCNPLRYREFDLVLAELILAALLCLSMYNYNPVHGLADHRQLCYSHVCASRFALDRLPIAFLQTRVLFNSVYAGVTLTLSLTPTLTPTLIRFARVAALALGIAEMLKMRMLK